MLQELEAPIVRIIQVVIVIRTTVVVLAIVVVNGACIVIRSGTRCCTAFRFSSSTTTITTTITPLALTTVVAALVAVTTRFVVTWGGGWRLWELEAPNIHATVIAACCHHLCVPPRPGAAKRESRHHGACGHGRSKAGTVHVRDDDGGASGNEYVAGDVIHTQCGHWMRQRGIEQRSNIPAGRQTHTHRQTKHDSSEGR